MQIILEWLCRPRGIVILCRLLLQANINLYDFDILDIQHMDMYFPADVCLLGILFLIEQD